MNSTIQPYQANAQDTDSPHWDRLYAVTGIMWGSLVGGAFWLIVLALIFSS